MVILGYFLLKWWVSIWIEVLKCEVLVMCFCVVGLNIVSLLFEVCKV